MDLQLFQFARALGGVTMASIPSNQALQFETVFTKVEDDKAKCDNMLEDEKRLLAVVVHSIPPPIQVNPLPQARAQVQGRGELSERLPLLPRPIQRPPRLRSNNFAFLDYSNNFTLDWMDFFLYAFLSFWCLIALLALYVTSLDKAADRAAEVKYQ